MNSAGRTRQLGIIILSSIIGSNAAVAELNSPWRVEPPMAVARDQFAGGVIDGKIYVFGGNGNPGGVNLKSTEACDLETGVWSFRADNEHNGGWGVEELTAAVVQGKLYVFGAYGGIAPDGYSGVFNFNEMYDPTTNMWTTLAQKPTTVAAGPAAVYNNEIYIFGGYFDSENPAQDHDTYQVVECYDPDSDSWRYVTDMPSVTEVHAVAVVDSKAYVIGGYSESLSSIVSDVVSFDFETGQWQTEGYAPLPSPLAFSYSSAAPVVGGKIYLVGGVAGDPEDNWAVRDVYIFDPVANTWQEGPPLPEPRENHLTVLHGERIYVVGGYADSNDENRALDGVLSLDVSPYSGTTYPVGGVIYTDLANPLLSGLEGVSVTLIGDGGTFGATTNGTQGLWQLENIPEGTYTVTPSKVSWHFEHIAGGVSDGQASIIITVDEANEAANQSIQFLAIQDAVVLHDWSGDGIVSIVGDVPPFVDCVYFGGCPGDVDAIAIGDCNGDGILSIVGDVPCFVDCVYFGSCP
jgi:N-acetylneuraminic acid mutarotase